MSSDPNYQFGRWLSTPLPGDEVVISGMSGRLPNSHNIHEFRDHLLNKEEMVSGDDRRWKLDHHEIPQRTAKVYNIDKYDAGYFGVHYRQADIMDPMMRMLLETAVESVMDAGVHPKEIEGSRTGVFISTSWSDNEVNACSNVTEPQNYAMTGYLRSLISHRVSYFLKLKGPACNVDAACSSSLNAFNTAFKAIRSGLCDNAIVGGTNLLIHPGVSLQFFRLGVLSKDGICRVFDQDASGYVRGETVACVFLQKAKNSRRIYAHVINTKVSGDGYKEHGITFPSTKAQKILMTEIYNESKVEPSQLSFLEAHGTGTQVGDPQEVEAIDRALAQRRSSPLLVGSVKSSIGHTEPASGVCSLIKILLAMETGIISPNINLKKIKEGMTAFEEGRMKAVVELTPLEEDDAIIGLNNFGFGGNNAHAILRRHSKVKVNNDLPLDDIPRLVCVSGRSENMVQELLDELNSKSLDVEYIGLLHQLYKYDLGYYRGYTIRTKNGALKTSTKFSQKQPPFYIFFGQFDKKFKLLGSYLLQFPFFNTTMSRINKILLQKRVKPLQDILQNNVEPCQNILGSICIQVALVDTIKLLDIQPTAIYGDSYAKLVCAYYYDVITLEETILAAVKSSQLDFDSNVRFQAQTIKNITDKLDYESMNHEKVTIVKNATVLNISDTRIQDRDVLLVENNRVIFLETLGRLFEEGHSPQIHKLYPEIKFPVSRGTTMISPFIKWDHRKSWYTFKFSEFTISDAEQIEHSLSYLYDEHKFIEGHMIDDRNFFPATEYLHLVWTTFAQSRRLMAKDLAVIFKNCKFLRAAIMPKTGFLTLLVTIQRGSGYFEILEKNSIVVSGYIEICNDSSKEFNQLDPIDLEDEPTKILEKDEIYRELYIRGYNYSGAFKGIEKCNVEGSSGVITWEKNWSSFIDKMLQMRILSIDTRLLFVPVGIKKLIIDPAKHKEALSGLSEEKIQLPVYNYKNCNIIKSGGVEIQGLTARSIARRKPRLAPVLEKNLFISNNCSLNLPEAVRINTQIVLENSLEITFKAVEIVETENHIQCLLPLVSQALDDVPAVIPELTISSKYQIEETPGVKVEVVTLTSESNILLIIGSNLLERGIYLKQLLNSVRKNGFVLSRERIDFKPEDNPDIVIVTEYITENEKIVLLKRKEKIEQTTFIEISSGFEWIKPLQTSLSSDPNIVLFSRDESHGLLGLANCLRREPNGTKIKCFLIPPELDLDSPLFTQQLQKNTAFNIFKDNTWGTYRHLLLGEPEEIEREHAYGNNTSRGDISSLRWLQGPLTFDTRVPEDSTLISVYYCSVNFKDIMMVSGRVNVETITMNRQEQECLIGIEVSGRDSKGRRVALMTTNGAMGSYCVSPNATLWNIPDHFTLEEGATVPVVYGTVLYALLTIGKLKSGTSILIHSATGGIGLAALNVCTHFQCDIYVTVGTQEKRDFLKKHYPQIPDSHIGNSRDTSFEEMIKNETKTRGVHMVLNSLTEDKLKASVRCLARGGKFLEIGKFDLGNDNSLEMLFIEKQISYHGVMIDRIFANNPKYLKNLIRQIDIGVAAGYVKPLPRIVFEKENMEAAYRHMMTGKHIGKVLVKMREEEKETIAVPKRDIYKVLPRFHCDPLRSYIIIGGLGGIGLELADWLFLRGAKKLVLVSRTGLQSGYQNQRIQILKTYGITVQISTKNTTTKQGCIDLIKEAQNLGPVDAIFNLAVQLKDALFEDQTEETFAVSLAPKAQATVYLDQVTRDLCQNLRYFVVFSSVSCGRGNPGQTNYGMANSIMERICEKRKKEGLPALAIQWGAVGEVGLVAKMQKVNKELVIGGTLQQRVSSCFEAMDRFLNQDHPVVSSMVVAEKHSKNYGNASAVGTVAQVLGIKDLKTVSHHSTLAELGMDSMMGTEIIQLLEKDFEIYLTPKDMRSMTLAKLSELETERKTADADVHKIEIGADLLIRNIPDSTLSHLPVLNLHEKENGTPIFVFPGLDGVFHPFETLIKDLDGNVMGVQYSFQNPEDTITEMAQNIVPHIQKYLSQHSTFVFVAYSYGAVVALETAAILELNSTTTGKVVLIDGSPSYLLSAAMETFSGAAEEEIQTIVICRILSFLLPVNFILEHKDKLLKCQSFQDRIDLAAELIPVDFKEKLDKQGAVTMNKRIHTILQYHFKHKKLSWEVHLFKAKFPMIKEEEDYQLSKICEKLVQVVTVEGDHATMLNQPELSKSLNQIILC